MKRDLSLKEKWMCVHLLQEAKKRLINLETTHICYALHISRQHIPFSPTLISCEDYLIKWVNQSLGGLHTYTMWVLQEHYKKYTTAPDLTEQLKLGRIAWIEWMIQELEAGR
jgi:hypothetical protein